MLVCMTLKLFTKFIGAMIYIWMFPSIHPHFDWIIFQYFSCFFFTLYEWGSYIFQLCLYIEKILSKKNRLIKNMSKKTEQKKCCQRNGHEKISIIYKNFDIFLSLHHDKRSCVYHYRFNRVINFYSFL